MQPEVHIKLLGGALQHITFYSYVTVCVYMHFWLHHVANKMVNQAKSSWEPHNKDNLVWLHSPVEKKLGTCRKLFQVIKKAPNVTESRFPEQKKEWWCTLTG